MNRPEPFFDWLRSSGWLGRRWLWTSATLVVLLMLIGDVRQTRQYYGVDLRNRIVGARLLSDGVDPYSYFWKQGDPERYLDGQTFDDHGRAANRVTVAPPMLMLYWTIADLRWKQVRLWWLAQQWMQFAAATALLTLAAPPGRRGLVCGVLLVGFLASDSVRRHVEVGQCYCVYTLIWSAATLCAAAPARVWTELALGALLGVAGVLRPTLLAALTPVAVSLRGWTLLGAALGAGGTVAMCWPWTGADIWASYFRLQEEIAEHRLLGVVPQHWRFLPGIPPTVEGVPNPGSYRDFGHGSANFPAHLTRGLPKAWRMPTVKAAMLAIVGVFVWGWRRTGGRATLSQSLLAGMALAITLDFFLPVNRSNYNNVLWMPAVAILLSAPQASRLLHGFYGVFLLTLFVVMNDVFTIGGNDLLCLADLVFAGAMLWTAVRLPRISAEPLAELEQGGAVRTAPAL